MALQFDFPQNADPTRFSAADWQRAARRAKTTPSPGSVTPTELSDSTTDLIDNTANAAATAKADAAKAAAVAESNANASTLAASAQANAISAAATALANHVDAPDPHPAYLTKSESDGFYLTQSQADARYLQQTLTLGNYANDAAAQAGGVAVGKLYRNGSVVMIRVV